jgi:hypothetical protein
MGVVYIFHGSEFVTAKLTMKWVKFFWHFSRLKFLVCTVLEVDFSSRVWRSNWYYIDIYKDSTILPGRTGGRSCHLVRCQLSSKECYPQLKKVRTLSHWQKERNIISVNFGYVIFPLKLVGVVAATLVLCPWCRDSSFSCAYP